ncbi:MAG TPA: hypothetical protein PLM16_01165 [Candidatus Woesebacteria bacterium]|nr:hypothetical protein [Candidatus Woesebacteria bacterium]
MLETSSTADSLNQNDAKKIWHHKFFKVGVLTCLGVILFAGVIYALWLGKDHQKEPLPPELKTEEKIVNNETVSPTPTLSDLEDDDEDDLMPKVSLNPQVISPATYGFTKVTDLPGIGARASFSDKATVHDSNPQTAYYVDLPDSSVHLAFTLYDYQGGSRRTWFLQNIGGYPESTFEAFGANNHQGYLVFSKDLSGNIYNLTYFAVIRTNKMLVVNFDGSQSHQTLEEFKSFLSTINHLMKWLTAFCLGLDLVLNLGKTLNQNAERFIQIIVIPKMKLCKVCF